MSTVEAEAPNYEPGFISPTLELVIHQGGININKIPTPDGTVTVLQFITPTMFFTIRLDDNGVENLIRDLQGGNIITPQNAGIVIPR